MLDFLDILDTPKNIVVSVLRAAWWLVWEFSVHTIGWTMGWCVLRIVSVGRFPAVPLNGVEQAGTASALWVYIVGLGTLAGSIWWLSGYRPGL